jgi:hypothetical protein
MRRLAGSAAREAPRSRSFRRLVVCGGPSALSLRRAAPARQVAAADAFGFADAPSGGLDRLRPIHSDGISRLDLGKV